MGLWQEDQTRFEGKILTTDQKTLRLNSVQSFNLPKNFTLELSGNYRSPGIRGFVRRKANGTLNIGLQKVLPNNNGRLSINVNDALKTFNYELYTDDPTIGFEYRGTFNFVERAVRISYTRNFGNNKLKRNRNRQTGSAEEQRRVN
jgi:hypothetical protein